MKRLFIIMVSLLLMSCGNGISDLYNERWGDRALVAFDTALANGERVYVKCGSASFFMVYANNNFSPVSFPVQTDDGETGILTRQFFIGQNEVTNELFAEVLQWALDRGKISETGTGNVVSVSSVAYGGQTLIDFTAYSGFIKISYQAASNRFVVVSGYEDYPVINLTWYGAVIFCNWLTEMQDGNTDNLVYSNISSSAWNYFDTSADESQTGYRLPSRAEWEYTARYRGDDSVNSVTGYSNPYYTKGDSASGADSSDSTESAKVAWYGASGNGVTSAQKVGLKKANFLGVYDMSGNVREWCFRSDDGEGRTDNGGSWGENVDTLCVGNWNSMTAGSFDNCQGFRLARTK